MSDILVIEDEIVLARSIVSFLERRGFSARFAVDAASAKAQFDQAAPRLAILDYKLNEDDGIDLLRWIGQLHTNTKVVMMTGHGDIDVAVRTMKAGARDFLVKPTPMASIAAIASELMLDEMQGGLDRTGVDRIIGRSSAANTLRTTIRKLARPQSPRPGVLIMGPAGSGKSLAAEALHESAAPNTTLVTFECSSAGLTEIEPAFRKAKGGSLLLRNISNLDEDAQTHLLHLLQADEASPAIIATSTEHLLPGRGFLPDLLYRIQVGWIDIPPLSDRAADVLPIAEYFARLKARDIGEARPRFTAAARAKLLEHDWPGHVAELRNCIERAMLVQSDGRIDAPDIRAISATETRDIPTLLELEKGAISQALARTGGNVSRSAELLGITRDTLRYRMEKLELSRK
ncbi:MAG: response regulator [Marivita sp.]|uniref:sigma-54-dependent transcriptional regulator n=1 Tax=Marivita sp. TaxID=2003365 RepID=UPI0025C0004D|nr:response regulator [Marivita sp.]MCI5112598.1 response regulator [Marivita sp.]